MTKAEHEFSVGMVTLTPKAWHAPCRCQACEGREHAFNVLPAYQQALEEAVELLCKLESCIPILGHRLNAGKMKPIPSTLGAQVTEFLRRWDGAEAQTGGVE